AQLDAERGMAQERLDLGAEQEVAGGFGVVERFDAVAIAGQHQRSAPPIPDRQREHAVEASEAFLAPLRVCDEHDLRIRLRAEAMAKPLELGPELTEVINLPVERQHELAGAIDHRLMTR